MTEDRDCTDVPSIEPGDVVKLKSGGPAITVSRVYEGEATCVWFSGAEVFTSRFNIHSLIRLAE